MHTKAEILCDEEELISEPDSLLFPRRGRICSEIVCIRLRVIIRFAQQLPFQSPFFVTLVFYEPEAARVVTFGMLALHEVATTTETNQSDY
jgi:hypothetical protein